LDPSDGRAQVAVAFKAKAGALTGLGSAACLAYPKKEAGECRPCLPGGGTACP